MSKLLLEDPVAGGMILAAGWTGEDAVHAYAISQAEAGDWRDPQHRIDAHAVGDLTLQNDTWGPSIGTMQIRSLKADKGTGRLRDEIANFDAQTCYRHAFALWQREGWRPWSTEHSGAYRQWLQRGAIAIANARPHPGFVLTRYLRWRDGAPMLHGGDVLWVQRRVYDATHPTSVYDGLYGPDTMVHVKAWQRTHALLQDGIVGPRTLHSLDPSATWAG